MMSALHHFKWLGRVVGVAALGTCCIFALAEPSLSPEQKERLKERDRHQAEVQKAERDGKLAEAIAAAEKMLAVERQVLGEAHEDTAGSLDWLARLYSETGDFAKASAAADAAVTIQAKLHGGEHWQTVAARRNRDDVELLSKLEEADRRRVFEVRRLSSLAIRFYNQHQDAKSLQRAQQVVEVRRQLLGDAHPDTARALNFLGIVQERRKDFAQAEALYRQATEVWKKADAGFHPDHASALQNLAQRLRDRGDLDPAGVVYRQAAALFAKTLGEAHARTHSCLNGLAVLRARQGRKYEEDGDFAAARTARQEVVDLYARTRGADHWWTRDARLARADVDRLAGMTAEDRERLRGASRLLTQAVDLSKQGKLQQAVTPATQALETRLALLGQDHPEVASVRMTLGYLMRLQKDYKGAVRYYEHAVAIREKALGDAHPDTAYALNALALSLDYQGELDAARKYYERALAVHRKAQGDESLDVAIVHSNLGYLLRTHKDYPASRTHFERSLAIRRKVQGDEHPDTVQIVKALDGVLVAALNPKQYQERLQDRNRLWQEVGKLRAGGKLPEAVANLEKMLALQRELFGHFHADTAAVLTTLAELHEQAEDFTRARTVRREALAVYRQLVAADNYQIADAVRLLAEVDRQETRSAADRAALREAAELLQRSSALFTQGKTAEAVLQAQKAVDIRRRVLGDEHADTATALVILAATLRQQGDKAKPRALFEEALAINKKVLVPNHPSTAILYVLLGNLSRDEKDYPAARRHLEQAVGIYQRSLGELHAQTIRTEKDLAALIAAMLTPEQRKLRLAERDRLMGEVKRLRDAGKLDEALAAVEKALAIDREVLGNRHDNVGADLDWLGWLQERRQNFPAAIQARQEELAIYRKLYGDQDWWTVNTRLDLADVTALARLPEEQRQRVAEADRLTEQAASLFQKEKSPDALTAANQALEIHRAVLGDRTRRRMNDLSWLGMIHRRLKDYAKAEEFDRQALELSRQMVGEQHPDTATRLWNLALLYAEMKDLSRASALMRQSLAIRRQTLGEKNQQTTDTLNQLVTILQAAVDAAVTKDDLRAARQAGQEVLDLQRKRQGNYKWDIDRAQEKLTYIELLTHLDPDKRRSLREAAELARKADSLQWKRQYAEALAPAREALAKREQALPAEHPDIVNSLSVAAYCAASAGQVDEAVPLYVRLLAIRRRHKDKDSYSYTSTRDALFNLLEKEAGAAVAREDFTAARKLRQQSLDLHQEHFGARDWHTTQARRALEHVAVVAGLTAEQRRTLAETGPTLDQLRGQIKGRVYLTRYHEEVLAEYRKTVEPSRRVLATRRTLLGDAHPATAEALHVVGLALKAVEDYEPAQKALRQALDARRKLLGVDHPDTLQSFDALSAALAAGLAVEPAQAKLTPAQVERLQERDKLFEQSRSAKRLDEAIASAVKMVAIEREVRGNDHDETLASLARLSELYLKWPDFNRARQFADEVVATKTRLHGANHWQTVEARFQVRQIETLRRMSADQRRRFWDAYYMRWDVKKKLPRGPGQFEQGEDNRIPVLLAEAERVSNTVKALLGEEHLYYANCLAGLAKLHGRKGDAVWSGRYYLRAAEITGQVLGQRNPAYLQRLDQAVASYVLLANKYEQSEDWDGARQAWQKRLDILTRLPGGEPWEIVNARLRLAVSERLSRLDRAQRKQLDLEDNEDRKLYPGGAAEKMPHVEKILQARVQFLGENSREAAQSFARLGRLQKQMGDFGAAVESLRKALAIRKAVLGEEHLEYVEGLNDLGLLYYAAADYPRAEPLLSQARRIMAKLDRLHPAYLSSLNNLAVLYQAVGDLARADECLREAQDAPRQRAVELGPPTKEGAIQLSKRYEFLMGQFNLGTALVDGYDYVTDPQLAAVLPEDAATLNNRALLYIKRREFGRASVLLREAMGIIKQTTRDRDEEPVYALALDNMATVSKELGETEQAELLYRRAVQLRKKKGVPDARLANALNNQAQFYFERGDLDRAEQLWREALAIRKNLLGENHPNTVVNLANLALVSEMRGEMPEADKLMQTALGGAGKDLELAFALQSERLQVSRMQAMRGYVDYYLSLAQRAHLPADRWYQPVLAWKGSVFVWQQRMRRQRGTGASANSTEEDRLYRELESVTRELGGLVLAQSKEAEYSTWKIGDLTKRKEDIERSLAGLSRDFKDRQTIQHLTPEQLRAALPPDVALIDLLEYNHFAPPKKGEAKGQVERRVLAFVVRRGPKDVAAIELGAAAPIAAAVERWRLALEKRKDASAAGAELRQLVWQPLEAHLSGARALLISPDGVLARVPFAALPGKKPGSYLLEELPLAQAPVPQVLPELLARRPGERAPATALLVLGDVDFGAAPPTKSASPPRFAALPGTANEITVIQGLFEKTHEGAEVRPLRGADATGGRFRERAPGAAYLHLATHGFFAPLQARSALAPSAGASAAGVQPWSEGSNNSAHPGALSGVVFAGVNRASDKGGEAILTSLEVGSLDLRGTELVVLSACQTGLGDVAGGEGVMGLQRAFHLAGARTVVASLWKVNDAATAALMSRFYDNLWRRKMGPAKALRQAQLALLHRQDAAGPVRGFEIVEGDEPTPRQPHPSLWAAWVLSGDPGKLADLEPAPSPKKEVPASKRE